MQFGSNGLGSILRRWRDRLRSRLRPSDDDPFEPRPRDRHYELWAYAMAPEHVGLAAMALRERDPPVPDGHPRGEERSV